MSDAKALDRKSILDHIWESNGDWPRERVHVPAWGGVVWCRCLSAQQRDMLESEHAADVKAGKPSRFRPRLVMLGTEDDRGQYLFGKADLDDLSRRPVTEIEPLVNAILRLSGMTPSDVEDAEKNSGSGPSESSSSDWPSTSADSPESSPRNSEATT